MNVRDSILAFSVPINWGLGFTLAKVGLSEFPPLFLMGMRFSAAALTLLWFVSLPKGDFIKIFWISLLGFSIQYGLTFTGLSMIDASLAVIVVQLEVPFGVLLAILFLKEKPGGKSILGMLLAFGGIYILVGQPNLKDQIFPILLTASGGLMWAVGQIMVKRFASTVNSLSLVVWVAAFSGPQLIIGSFLLETGQLSAVQEASWIGWSTVIYLGLIMTGLGYGVWYRILSRNPVSQVLPVLLILPFVTIITSIIFLGEDPTLSVLLGGAIILSGVALIMLNTNSTKANENMP